MKPLRWVGAVLLLPCAGIVAACAHRPCETSRPETLSGPAPQLAEGAQRPFGNSNLGDISDAGLRSAIQALADDARQTVGSETFERALARRPTKLVSGVCNEEISGAVLLADYNGANQNTTSLRPLSYEEPPWWRVWGCSGETAHTALHDPTATIVLQSCTQDRARKRAAPAPGPYSCAINTIAHEWAHTLVDVQTRSQLYRDANHNDYPNRDIVSYTIGALAQCSYLANHGFIPPNDKDIDECVSRVKTNIFNASSCEPGWSCDPKPAWPSGQVGSACGGLRQR